MGKLFSKDIDKEIHTIKGIKNNTSRGGSQMGNNLNIFDKQNLVNKLEDVKKEMLNRRFERFGRGFKRIVLKGITLASALAIMMSSVAFAGEHTVNNWEDYKNAIIQDILNQEESIVVNYEGDDVFLGNDLNQKVIDMYNEAMDEIRGRFEGKNVHLTQPSRDYQKNPDGTYSLKFGQYNITYKNSADDVREVQGIVDDTLSQIINPSMNDYEKVRAVYDFIINAYYYEENAEDDDKGNLEEFLRERNLLSGLSGDGIVCDAYAMLFSKMVTDLGYENIIVSGTADGGGHAWNLINIGGQWYHVDPTWGDMDVEGLVSEFMNDPDYAELGEEFIRNFIEEEAEKKKDSYFLISDDDLRESRHNWDSNMYPSAPETFNIDGAEEKVLIQESSDIKLDIQGLLDEIQELRDEIEGLDSEEQVQVLRNKVQELLEQVGELSVDVQDLRERAEGLSSEELDALLTELDGLIEVLEPTLNNVLSDLDNKENEIYEAFENEALEAIEIAELSGLESDILIAKEKIQKLKDGESKTELLGRIEALEEQIENTKKENLVNEAMDAILLAEGSKSESDILTAKQLILALREQGISEDVINELTERIEDLEEVIIEEENERQLIQEALDAVMLAEETKSEEDILIALEKIQGLNDEELKESLLNRLNELEIEEPGETGGEESGDKGEGEEGEDTEEPEEPEEPETEEPENPDESGEEPGDKDEGEDIEEPEEPENPDTEDGDKGDGEDTEEPESPDIEDGEDVENPDTEDGEDGEDGEEPENPDTEDGDNGEGEDTEEPEEPEVEEPEDPDTEDGENGEGEDEDGEESEEPEIEEPEIEEPEIEEPEIEEPEVEEPEIEEPEIEEPEVEEPEIEEPEIEEPDSGEVEEEIGDKDSGGNNNVSEPDKPNNNSGSNTSNPRPSNPRPSNPRPSNPRPSTPVVEERPSKPDNERINPEEKEEVKMLTEEEMLEIAFKVSREKVEEIKILLKVLPSAKIEVSVGGKEVKPDVKPYIYKEEQEKILIPIRFIAEALGFEVNWSKATDSSMRVFLNYQDKAIIMEIGRDFCFINGEAIKMDIAPEIHDNRTYVSLDFIIEILEKNFEYLYTNSEVNFNIK